MRNRTRLLISRSVLLMIGAIFLAGWPQLSYGQSDFYLYQLEVHCIPRAAAVIFTVQGSGMMGTKQVCAGKCDGGIVTLDEALAKFPAGVSAALRAKVAQHEADAAAGKVQPVPCLRNGKESPEDKKQDCRENSDSPNGKNCCDNMPGNGMLYASTKNGRIYSEPSTNSTLVGSLPSGTRLRYTNKIQVNGQTWYYIESPGPQRQGWMPGNQLSCTRPVEPPSPKIILDPKLMDLYQGTAAHAHAARG